ncbi:MAG: SUMF1/EgtB/PvdO family nonheme iron enzyme [Bacteroidetes bacterium]|nr:SUMF1/EgtB/PvdO family nonheme iron enzyme [Bacteroidota bacterium]
MRTIGILISLLCIWETDFSQVQSIRFEGSGALKVDGVIMKDKSVVAITPEKPLFSVLIDSNFYQYVNLKSVAKGGEISFTIADSIAGSIKQDKKFQPGLRFTIRFTNLSRRSHSIENLVPLGEGNDKVYITAGGTKDWPQYLCRSLLFRPGYGPIGVILPDNAWHLGFADYKVNDSLSLTGLARRGQRLEDKTTLDRWAVTLKPGGWVEYNIYFDIHKEDDWHAGLKMMFQDRFLYDLPSFDNSMFQREDLKWMKSTYIMLLQFAWDKKFFDEATQKYTFYKSVFEHDSLTGGYDIFTLWPTWPRLGLDQRNQWDMYKDLPGGLFLLKKEVDFLHSHGKKYFISYNPWDEAGGKEKQMEGMEQLLKASDADGVVLDTRGSSSKELQETADKVKPGIIMYSEGMAIPKDMPGIVAGRVHDALVDPPPLNLNKFIKPDFAIFRVLQLADDRLHRELAISFFNGYGVEINTMRPGRPSWIREEYAYLGRTTKILRENNSVFHNNNWVPLLPSLTDSIYVNRWYSDEKVIYTIYSLKPGGFNGPLFNVPPCTPQHHYIDLWNHREIQLVAKEGKDVIPAVIDPFDKSFLKSRREGNVGCIALFPKWLTAYFKEDTLVFTANKGDKIVLTGENPTYHSIKYTFSDLGNSIPYLDYFEVSTEKIVVQLFGNDELLDEVVLFPNNRIPKLISKVKRTTPLTTLPDDMVEIREGFFRYYTKRDSKSLEPFIAFPDHSDTVTVHMDRFYMDKYPITNRQFLVFLKKAKYSPSDTTNFLKHWVGGRIPDGENDYPVVYVSLEDARQYALWARKRLPTEIEWQYAAQGIDMRKYPWGNYMDSTRCNYHLNHSTSVFAYPRGASPFGVEDMVGNVWQMTNDMYDIGCYYYNIIRGGSYYYPTASIWYITGGPLPADHPEMLLLLAPGLDRNGTVGFRLMKDAK